MPLAGSELEVLRKNLGLKSPPTHGEAEKDSSDQDLDEMLTNLAAEERGFDEMHELQENGVV